MKLSNFFSVYFLKKMKMKTFYLKKNLLFLFIFGISHFGYSQTSQTSQATQSILGSNLRFEENKGQIKDREILYSLKDNKITLFFDKNGIKYRWNERQTQGMTHLKLSESSGSPTNDIYGSPEDQNAQVQSENKLFDISMRWSGSNSDVEIIAEKPTMDYSNYYLSSDKAGVTGVKSYTRLVYKNIYPNTDVVYYIQDEKLKYDVLLHPGADLEKIKIIYSGQESIFKDGNKIKVSTSFGDLTEFEPIASSSTKPNLNVEYLINNGSVSFNFKDFQNKICTEEIVIDPLLGWSSFYGGTGNDEARSTTVNNLGEVYIGGFTTSTTSISSGGYQNSNNGGLADAFLVKFDANGNRLWATYFGGSGNDFGRGVAVDLSNNIYLTGETTSTTSISLNGHQAGYGGGNFDGFLLKLNSNGQIQWASYYGGAGDDLSRSVATDSDGNVFIGGETTSSTSISFNGFQNSFGGGIDGFIAKFSGAGVRLWATYFGNNGFDPGNGICVDNSKNVYLVGNTNSSIGISFNGQQNSFGGIYDAYLVKFSSAGSRLWATYYGGSSEDYGYSVTADPSSNVYITGHTNSTSGIAFNGFQNTIDLGYDSYVAKFNGIGQRLYGSYNKSLDQSFSIIINTFGYIYQAGYVLDGKVSTGAIGSISIINKNFSKSRTYNGFGTGTDNGNVKSTFYSISSDASGNSYLAGSAEMPSGAAIHIVPENYNGFPRISIKGFQNSFGGGSSDAIFYKAHFEMDYVSPIYPQSGLNPAIDLSSTTIKKRITDQTGNIYIVGYTEATSGIAQSGHQNIFGGGFKDAFLAKYNSSGIRLWSTYYGGAGTDFGFDIAIDASGSIYIAGITMSLTGIAYLGHDNTFSGSTNTLTGPADAFIAKFDTNGVRVWGTYYGDLGYEDSSNIGIDNLGNVYLGGSTTSSTSIAFNGFQNSSTGSSGYLCKFTSSGTRIWGTYYGNNGVGDTKMVIDDLNNVFLGLNVPAATTNFSFNGYQNTYVGGIYDNAVVKFDSNGNRQWATYVGSSTQDELIDILKDRSGNIYIHGTHDYYSLSATVLTTNNAFQPMLIPDNLSTNNTGFQNYLVKMSNSGQLLGSTYLFYEEALNLVSTISINDDFTLNMKGRYFGNFLPALSSVIEPSTQPTSLIFSNIRSSSLTLSYTFASGNPNGYLIVRKQGSVPTGVPMDGLGYSSGQTLGDGIVVYSGISNFYIDSNLTPGVQYFYKVFSYNGTASQVNYLTISPLSGSATTSTLAIEPTSQPTNFTIVTRGIDYISAQFTAASGSTNYIVLAKESGVPTFVPSDGVSYSPNTTVGDSYVVASGSSVTFTHFNLLNATSYNYAIYSYNGTGALSNYRTASPLIGSATTLAGCTRCVRKSTNENNGEILTAKWDGNNALISWTKVVAPLDKYSVIEKSIDGINFMPIETSWVVENDSIMTSVDMYAKESSIDKVLYRVKYKIDYEYDRYSNVS
ncbi:MAG: hypothetical protein HOP30_17925, partial [Cyclobacteriaceae bacterium]|nr:hypothetical protein [Cyclobacteriaceae bacterium]